jgi:hypothetical protein
MTALAQTLPGITKEVRALLYIWVACVLTLAAATILSEPITLVVGGLATVFGLITLGAQSFGHEYTHRTLPQLLAQPIDRRRVYLIKYGVLALMVVMLAMLAWRVRVGTSLVPRNWREAELILLATACGLFIAPWLTLVCRSVLAGAVFTIAVPGVLAIAGDVAGGILYGFDRAADIDRFKYLVLWRGMIVICAVALVASFRTFMRLEATEGRGADLQLPQRIGTSTDALVLRRRHPIRLLIGKEIRLQQISFVVVGLYIATWLVVSWLERSNPATRIVPLELLSFLYSALLSLLIGALSSAEERQYGTLEAQRLLPIPAWQQWVVKAGMAIGLAVLFASILPLALTYVSPTSERLVPAFVMIWWLQTLAMSLTMVTIGLYVSTLSSSGVRALVASFPAAIGLFVFVQFAAWLIWLVALRAFGRGFVAAPDVTWIPVFVAWCSVVCWYGYYNHQSTDRSPRRIAGQVLVILAWTVVLLAVLAGLA